MHIHESGEDYLETIYKLKKVKPYVRSVDIIEARNYSKSSVSRAVNLLKDGGYITIGQDGQIDFTFIGKQKAETIYARHEFLTSILVKMGVDKSIAEEDACKMEHDLSNETIEALHRLSTII